MLMRGNGNFLTMKIGDLCGEVRMENHQNQKLSLSCALDSSQLQRRGRGHGLSKKPKKKPKKQKKAKKPKKKPKTFELWMILTPSYHYSEKLSRKRQLKTSWPACGVSKVPAKVVQVQAVSR